MGDLVEMRPATRPAVAHPSLRWLAGDVYWLAHRRNLDTRRPECGATGDLVLATVAVPLCGSCFPGHRS